MYLVVSDNHASVENLWHVLESYRGKIEALIHCGDMEITPVELEKLAGCPVYMAVGNCDYHFGRDRETLFEMGEHVALVTHGDYYGVNYGEEELLERALELGADLVFYGHTHCPAYHEYAEEGVTLFNPGSIAQPRQMEPKGPTFLTVELQEDGKVVPKFYVL